MIKKVSLRTGNALEGGENCTVRLKENEFYKGWSKIEGEEAIVVIPTGIPANDFSVNIQLHDGQTVIGRLVSGQFQMS